LHAEGRLGTGAPVFNAARGQFKDVVWQTSGFAERFAELSSMRIGASSGVARSPEEGPARSLFVACRSLFFENNSLFLRIASLIDFCNSLLPVAGVKAPSPDDAPLRWLSGATAPDGIMRSG
jgi:hypothetical protein